MTVWRNGLIVGFLFFVCWLLWCPSLIGFVAYTPPDAADEAQHEKRFNRERTVRFFMVGWRIRDCDRFRCVYASWCGWWSAWETFQSWVGLSVFYAAGVYVIVIGFAVYTPPDAADEGEHEKRVNEWVVLGEAVWIWVQSCWNVLYSRYVPKVVGLVNRFDKRLMRLTLLSVYARFRSTVKRRSLLSRSQSVQASWRCLISSLVQKAIQQEPTRVWLQTLHWARTYLA